jgi:RNA polymerase sigma factor (sigma-70 family)
VTAHDEREWLAERFEAHRARLRGVAYRMLGSLSEADDAMQEAWLRLSRADTGSVENLGGWLTTIVARVSLDMLRSRNSLREESLSASPPIASAGNASRTDPEHEAILADSVGLALLVVLERLNPAERLAFVLHDMFAVPFDEIGAIVGRSPTAARQLASRARRRVQGAKTGPNADLARQREVVDAFLAALRSGDFEGLLAVLDPDVVVRAPEPAGPPGAMREVRGAPVWAKQALAFSQHARFMQPALIDGSIGAVWAPHGRLVRVLRFTMARGRIKQIEVVADPTRLGQLELAVLDD